MRKILVKIIKIYQNYISINMLHSCRFYPSCSEYTCQAIEKTGIIKGVIRGICRVLRCNAFSKGGYDPVK